MKDLSRNFIEFINGQLSEKENEVNEIHRKALGKRYPTIRKRQL